MISRNYLLSVLRTPEKDPEAEEDVVPFVGQLQLGEGSRVSNHDYVEYFVPKFTGSTSADGYFRYKSLGTHFEKMLAMDVLTTRMAQYRPEGEKFAIRKLSYLDTERELFGMGRSHELSSDSNYISSAWRALTTSGCIYKFE